jgi:hypothetical protein
MSAPYGVTAYQYYFNEYNPLVAGVHSGENHSE